MPPYVRPSKAKWALTAPMALGSLVIGILTIPAVQAATPTDAMANGTFTSSTNGWVSQGGGSLQRVSDNPLIEMVNTTTAARNLTLNDQLNTVNPVQVAATYVVSARVRSVGRAGDVELRAQEWGNPAGKWTMAGSGAQRKTLAANVWTKLSFGYTAKKAGFTLDINLLSYSTPVGAVVQVDDLTVTDSANKQYALNSTFDAATSGYYMSTGGTVRAGTDAGEPTNGPFARVTNATGSPAMLTLTDQPESVTSSGVGDRYSASARVRSSALAGQQVILAVTETSGGAVVGQGQSAVTFTSAGWADVNVGYSARQNGSSVGVDIGAPNMPAAGTLDVDDVKLIRSANDVPAAAFVAAADGLAVRVDGSTSTDPDGSVASWAWDFGDGSTGTGAIATRTYAAAGTYPIKLTVTDDRGATSSKTLQTTLTGPTLPAGWNKVAFTDDFNGSSVSASNWSAYNNTYGDGNHELACLTPGNVTVAGGVATVSSRKETVTCPGGSVRNYTSGFLGSREAGKYYPLYGRYEIRAQVPHGQGLWPAFWLRHRNGSGVAEVDIMEYFHNQVPGKATQTLHFPSTLGRNVAKKSTFFETPVLGTGSWHTFAVEIEPVAGADGTTDVRFRFYIDNSMTLEYVNATPEAWNQTDPNATWDIAFNTAVGGDWVGDPEKQLGYLPYPNKCSLTYKAPTNNDPTTCPTTGIQLAQLPGQYRVDWVRVFTK